MSSRVTLWFDVVNSQSLSPEQKELVLRRLQTHIGKDGLLRVISQQTRSQGANRESAVNRFILLLPSAVKQIPIRRKTRVSKAPGRGRLEEKRRHSFLKREWSKRVQGED